MPRTSVSGKGDSGVILDATLSIDPYSVQATDLIPELRRVAQDAGLSFSVIRIDDGSTLPVSMRVEGGAVQRLREDDPVGGD